jgi:hypothetical protein
MQSKKSGQPFLRLWIFILVIMSPLKGVAQERLVYHDIVTDKDGNIIPWYDKDLGKSFDHIINLVWNFWDTMRIDMNGLPYYMNHQVWEEKYNDRRGIGGDQLQMALSAWRLLYAYTGNERVKANMCFMADYYLSHSLSRPDNKWPDIPYPYNTLIYSGIYDGDMVIGKNFTQPDKAGSFGYELVNLYKITGLTVYLDAAIKIANTLASHTENGDYSHSPLPFKVNATTGEAGTLVKEVSDPTPVAHYLRAMAADPELAPSTKNHILSSTSVIQQADYHGRNNKMLWNENDQEVTRKPLIHYRTFDEEGTEVIRMVKKPSGVLLDEKPMTENGNGEGYTWHSLGTGGILNIDRLNGNRVQILF